MKWDRNSKRQRKKRKINNYDESPIVCFCGGREKSRQAQKEDEEGE